MNPIIKYDKHNSTKSLLKDKISLIKIEFEDIANKIIKKKHQTNEYGTPQGGNIGGVVNMFYI